MSMELALEVSALSAHVKYGRRETVLDALPGLGVARGTPLPVWPARKFPGAPWAWLFVSPSRNGWVSMWGPPEAMREWLPKLTATLECPGLVLEVVESRFWVADFLQDGEFLGRVELPQEAVALDLLQTRAVESMEEEGVADPWADEIRLAMRMNSLSGAEAYQEELRQMAEQRPPREALRPFLPPHASLERAWELLTAIDRHETEAEADEGSSPYAEDYLEAFASYLLIRDAAWDPEADAEALAEGDYEDEEGFPEGWTEFVALPLPTMPVL